MTTAELIALLQAADPAGTTPVCVGNEDVYFVDRLPAYYDGQLQQLVHDPAKVGKEWSIIGARVTSKGEKVKIVTMGVRDLLSEHPDIPVEGLSDEDRARMLARDGETVLTAIRAVGERLSETPRTARPDIHPLNRALAQTPEYLEALARAAATPQVVDAQTAAEAAESTLTAYVVSHVRQVLWWSHVDSTETYPAKLARALEGLAAYTPDDMAGFLRHLGARRAALRPPRRARLDACFARWIQEPTWLATRAIHPSLALIEAWATGKT